MSTIDPSAQPSPAAPAPVRRKGGIGKLLLKLFVAAMLLVVVALVVLYFNLNSLVRAGVVRGGQYATDQTTTLDMANLAFSSGSLQLDGLGIANLKGYTTPTLLSMKKCETIVQPGSLLTHNVIVESIQIDGLELTLEQNNLRNNVADLIDIIQKKTAAADTTSAKTSPGKQLTIKKLQISGTKVHLVSKDLGLKLDFDLGPIEMTDPTNPDGRPMKIADLIGRILIHLSEQIVENPAIPGNIKDQMKNVTALVNKLGPELNKNVKVLTKSLQDVGKNLQDLSKDPGTAVKNLQDTGKNLQDATKGLQDAGKNATDSMKNLLNSNKNDKPKK